MARWKRRKEQEQARDQEQEGVPCGVRGHVGDVPHAVRVTIAKAEGYSSGRTLRQSGLLRRDWHWWLQEAMPRADHHFQHWRSTILSRLRPVASACVILPRGLRRD